MTSDTSDRVPPASSSRCKATPGLFPAFPTAALDLRLTDFGFEGASDSDSGHDWDFATFDLDRGFGLATGAATSESISDSPASRDLDLEVGLDFDGGLVFGFALGLTIELELDLEAGRAFPVVDIGEKKGQGIPDFFSRFLCSSLNYKSIVCHIKI